VLKIGPTCGLATSPEESLGATVDTLQTGYPRIQASSQDKEQGVHPRAATYHVALDHTSLQRWALALPRVLRPQTLPLCRGGLRHFNVSRGLRPRLLGVLRRCHVSPSSEPRFPVEVGSGASTCPMAPGSASLRGRAPVLSHLYGSCRLWKTGIRKGLAALGTQLSLHVSKVRSHVTKASTRRADMSL
jgi:hypothetical protein